MLTKTDLHAYQQETITELYERDHVMAIVPMGGGKTVSALTAAQELMRDGVVRRGIVLAPKRVASEVWPREVGEWEHLGGLDLVLVSGSPARREKLLNGPGDLFVVGIDNTQWLTGQIDTWAKDDPRLDLLIIDELSRYKGATGKRARSLTFVADRFKNRWGLTGTPRPNSEIDMYQPSRIIARRSIWPEPFDHWRMKYFIPDDPYTQFNWDIRDEWRDKIWSDIANFSFTIDADRLPPQPELVPLEHWVKLPDRARTVFREMLADLVTMAGGEMIEAYNAGVASGKLDQIAQGFIYKDGDTKEILHHAKRDLLADLTQSLGGQQAMITYWFKEDLEAIRTVLGDRVPVLGSVTSEKRARAAVDAWNARDTQFIAVHPASAGHGLNLQKGHAGQIIHYCPTWSAELFDQVNARIARQGNEQPRVMNHLILAEDTFDIVKIDRVRRKLEGQQAFIEYVRSLQDAR